MIRLGIAGIHHSLFEIVQALRTGSDFQITGMFSIQEKELFDFSEKLMIQPVIIPDTLILRADALLVVSDPADYYELLTKSIQLSRHLFLYTLGTLSLKQIESLIKLAEEAQVVIYHPGILGTNIVRALKQFIHQPFYIEISCLKSYVAANKYSLEDLRYFTSKGIEALLIVNAGSILKIQPNAAAIFSEQVDFLNVRVDFANGCAGIITTGLFAEKEEFIIRSYQRNEILELDFIRERISIVSPGKVRSVADLNLRSEKKPGFIFELDLTHFQDMILKAENSLNSLEQSYRNLLLTNRIFEKVQIPVFQEKQF